ncbi:MAG: ribosomal protein [Polaromonas sp.]|nr:ribosomal protein [Polaromonas sp.]
MVWVATETNRKGKIMKEGIHPNYREVCFLDLSNNFKFVTRSCVNTKEMVKMEDGRDLPLYKLDTSSESHPFYTGTQKSVDNMGGRVERFRNRFGKTAAKEISAEPVPEAAAAAAE